MPTIRTWRRASRPSGGSTAKQGKLAEAEPLLKRAISTYESTLGADHPHVARCCAKMAHACCAGEERRGRVLLQASDLDLREGPAAADPVSFAKALEEYAKVLRNTNRAAEAEKIEARAKAIREGPAKTQ